MPETNAIYSSDFTAINFKKPHLYPTYFPATDKNSSYQSRNPSNETNSNPKILFLKIHQSQFDTAQG